MTRLLVVEDDPTLLRGLSYNLRSELSEEIPPEGKSGLKYDLKSK